MINLPAVAVNDEVIETEITNVRVFNDTVLFLNTRLGGLRFDLANLVARSILTRIAKSLGTTVEMLDEIAPGKKIPVRQVSTGRSDYPVNLKYAGSAVASTTTVAPPDLTAHRPRRSK